MRQGVTISAAGHGVLILAVLVGMPDWRDDVQVLPAQVTDVSLISASAFEAAQSAAPDAPEDNTANMAAPAEDAAPDPTPAQDTAPNVTPTTAPNAPEAEQAPQLDALTTDRPPTPTVVTDLTAPVAETEAAPRGFDTPLPDGPERPGALTTTQTAMLQPQTPNLAPRIDTTAAPRPPEAVPEGETSQPERSEDSTEPPVEEPPKPAEAPKEAATDTSPDAKPQDNPLTPSSAQRPQGRQAALAADEARRKAADAAAAAAATAKAAEDDAAQKPEPDPGPSVDDLIRQTAAETKPDPGPSQPVATPGIKRSFNGEQSRTIAAALQREWNVANVTNKANFEQLVVTVSIQLSADGKAMGDVVPVNPRNPSGDFKFAFDTARRAVLIAARKGIPLPQGTFRNGDILEIRFDPGRGGTVVLDQ